MTQPFGTGWDAQITSVCGDWPATASEVRTRATTGMIKSLRNIGLSPFGERQSGIGSSPIISIPVVMKTSSSR
jgi:hypothetical protein